jgi:hypothetical protein
MNKEIAKALKKYLYTVILTSVFIVVTFRWFQQKIYEKNEAIAGKEIKMKMDSAKMAIILMMKEDELNRNRENLAELKKMYLQGIATNAATKQELVSKQQQLDDKLLLAKYIESLRMDFGLIEPGVQVLKDDEYRTKYNQQEATLILAVELSKKLNVYNSYKEFFKNQEGIWNMVMAKR